MRNEKKEIAIVMGTGVVLIEKSILLTNTTPSARVDVAAQLFFIAQPPLLC